MYIKSRIVSLIYKIIFVIIGIYGIFLISTMNGKFNLSTFNYYTNLSNVLCVVFMLIAIFKLIKIIKKDGIKGDSNIYPRFKGAVTIAITVTFLVYHFLLRPTLFKMNLGNEYNFANTIVHYIVPIMFILDYFLFDPKGKFKKYDPFLWIIIPYIYFGYALLIAKMGVTYYGGNRYPYFFIDIDIYGLAPVLRNVLLITIFFLILGYIIYGIDQILIKKRK